MFLKIKRLDIRFVFNEKWQIFNHWICRLFCQTDGNRILKNIRLKLIGIWKMRTI